MFTGKQEKSKVDWLNCADGLALPRFESNREVVFFFFFFYHKWRTVRIFYSQVCVLTKILLCERWGQISKTKRNVQKSAWSSCLTLCFSALRVRGGAYSRVVLRGLWESSSACCSHWLSEVRWLVRIGMVAYLSICRSVPQLESR